MKGGDDPYPKQAETNSALTIHLDSNVATTDSTMQDVVVPQTTNAYTPNEDVNHHEEQPHSRLLREQDMYLPTANVVRIMRSILPDYAKISDDAKEAMQECVSEFIHFLTGEANSRCQREQRKTVTAEDIIWAMKETGFDDYLGPITVFTDRYRESENGPPSAQNQPTMKRHRDSEDMGSRSFRVGNVRPIGIGGARPLGMSSSMPFGFIRPVGSMGPVGSVASFGALPSMGSTGRVGSTSPVWYARPVMSIPPTGSIGPIAEPIAPIRSLPPFESIGPTTHNLSPQQPRYSPSQMNPENFKNNNSDSAGGASSSQAYPPNSTRMLNSSECGEN